MMNIYTTLVDHLCYLPVREWVATVPAHATQDDLSAHFVTPLKRVRFGHCDGSKRIQSLTITSAAPIFATQPTKQDDVGLEVTLRSVRVLGVHGSGVGG